MEYNQLNTAKKGIDIQVDLLKDKFASTLFDGKNYVSYGIAELIQDEDIIIPVVYNSGINYDKVYPIPSGKDAVSFFIANNERSREEINSTKFNTGISIYFVVNLDKVYPDITTYRPTENCIHDIMKVISRNFEVLNYVTHQDAMNDFSIPNSESKKMHPFLFLKFNCNMTFNT